MKTVFFSISLTISLEVQAVKYLIVWVLYNTYLICDGVSIRIQPNATVFYPGKPFSLNCTVDQYSDQGVDWQSVDFVNGSEIHIYESLGKNGNNTQPGYDVVLPDNFTSILTVLHPNASHAGEYCCQFKNGQGSKSCGNVTEFITNKQSTVGEVTTPAIKVTKAGSLEVGVIVGLVLAVVGLIILLVVAIRYYRKDKKRRNDSSKGSQQQGGTEDENQKKKTDYEMQNKPADDESR